MGSAWVATGSAFLAVGFSLVSGQSTTKLTDNLSWLPKLKSSLNNPITCSRPHLPLGGLKGRHCGRDICAPREILSTPPSWIQPLKVNDYFVVVLHPFKPKCLVSQISSVLDEI